jgi:antitoxin HicB
MKTTEDYLDLPYRIQLTPDQWEDGTPGFFAEVPDLPGCMSQGASADEAVASVRDAMRAWITVRLEDGKEVPLPREEPSHNGRVLLRMPGSLHGELLRAAEADGVSLNQWAIGALAGAVGWRRREKVQA